MPRPCALFLIACLGSCATTASRPILPWDAPNLTGLMPVAPADDQKDKAQAPEHTTLPLGIGLTNGPSTALLGATLDLPFDKQLTFGPSLQYGIDDKNHLMTLTAQLKYFIPIGETESGSFSVLPYLTGGVGVASVDTQGHSAESGLVLNGGAGVRYLTGDHYRIGSEVRFNVMPDKLSGESTFLSAELLQVVLNF